jgi:O-acetyl-ADP-ribose deacetylase (regulator of RNase III)
METTLEGAKVILLCGDITEQGTDAIVNAANPGLMGGRGVDGAIQLKGGADILKECKVIRERYYPEGLPAGQAVHGRRIPENKKSHPYGRSSLAWGVP